MQRNLSRLFPVLLAVILVLLTFWLEYLLTNLQRPEQHQQGYGRVSGDRLSQHGLQCPRTDRQIGLRQGAVAVPAAKAHPFFRLDPRAIPGRQAHLVGIGQNRPLRQRQQDCLSGPGCPPASRTHAHAPNVATADTSKLTVNTEKRTADTNAPTVYQEGADRVTATGVHYNDVTQQLTLKSRVRMTHVPQ